MTVSLPCESVQPASPSGFISGCHYSVLWGCLSVFCVCVCVCVCVWGGVCVLHTAWPPDVAGEVSHHPLLCMQRGWRQKDGRQKRKPRSREIEIEWVCMCVCACACVCVCVCVRVCV